MQLNLLEYVLTPEELAPVLAEKPVIEMNTPCHISIGEQLRCTKGDRVRILRVDTLPPSLVGQVGTIEALIASDIAQIKIGDRQWMMTTNQLEKLETEKQKPLSLLLRWHQSKVSHREQVILRLSLADPVRYAALIQCCKAEIEEILAILEAR